ncbi:methyltransferase domain-containing protein [Phaeodactylibacter sp.]|uniref:class I SAM-dependent methyltransferase n=1 Tax=Phaeodactylibacter sp. TaxID=1940289 RepID=UPI0025DF9D75|nr:methyltransferase domain-containing protein [Phaeodactylibacter sp.]MCI5055372.1 class I SAM-dependent methyltransferase [Flavobacteriales bacterium]MCI5090782.1 class I SAM-dependent methyltransferase [Phaeodactylibacter sp.]
MSEYWKSYWKNVHITDPQITVGRTKFGDPVSAKAFSKEITFINKKLKVSDKENLLDLCAGNGLISDFFAPLVNQVTAVDISEVLLENFISRMPNIEKICQDLNEFDFRKYHYHKVIWHFSIQHFSLSNSVQIIKKCLDNIQEGGVFYIGDVPDLDKKWQFYSLPEYRSFYFDKLINGQDHIGTWFQKSFFIHLLDYLGYKDRYEIISKPEFHFNSGYRFDLLIWK